MCTRTRTWMWTCVRRACAQAGEAHRRAQRASADWRRGGELGRVRVCLCLPSPRPREGRRCSQLQAARADDGAPPPRRPRRRARAGCMRMACKYPSHVSAAPHAMVAGVCASFACSLRQDARARAAPRSQDAQVRPRTSTTGAKRAPSRGGLRCTAAPARCTAFRVRAPLRGCAPRRGAERPVRAPRRRVPRRPSVRRSSAAPRGGVRARCVRVLCCGAWRRGSSPFTGAPSPAIFPAWLSNPASQQMLEPEGVVCTGPRPGSG